MSNSTSPLIRRYFQRTRKTPAMGRVFIEDEDRVFEDTAEGSSSKKKSVKQTPSSSASEHNVIINEEIMSIDAFGVPAIKNFSSKAISSLLSANPKS